jgi:FkbM family methyltransferase
MPKNHYVPLISNALRFYLKYSPITEGKKNLVNALRRFSIPPLDFVVSTMKDGYKLKLNLKNKEHVHMFLYSEHDERYERGVLKRIIRNGDLIWDIGANIGYYTLLFSSLSPNGKTIAFEPASHTRKMLEENVILNKKTNISIQDFALGNDDAEAQIFFSDSHHAEGTASLIKDHGKDNSEKIKIKKIDSLDLKSFPDFIKIDVEGLHNEVLKGGKAFFRHHSPLMMVEIKDTPARDYDKKTESMAILAEMGYEAYEIKKHGITKQDDLHQGKARNYILCKTASHHSIRLKPLLIN